MKNWILSQAKELGISVAEYMKNTPYNYVIMNITDMLPVRWGSDNFPVIYGSEGDAMNDLEAEREYCEKQGIKDKLILITEWEYIRNYSFETLESILIDEIKNNGEYDGNCFIKYLNCNSKYYDDDMAFSVISAYVDSKDNLLMFLSDENDNYQEFRSLNNDMLFNQELIFSIINGILA